MEVAPYLLLVESDAEVPGWVSSEQIDYLDQQANEPQQTFVGRSVYWIAEHPEVSTVIVALSLAEPQMLEQHVRTHGERIAAALDGRTKARLLFSAPAELSEPVRRRLLALIATMAQHDNGCRACIIGAHFSAAPPSSARIPISAR